MARKRSRRRRPRPTGLRRFQWWFAAAGVLLVVVALAAAYQLTQAASDLRQARRLLDSAGAAIEDGRLANARSGLRSAQVLVTSANDRLYGHPELDLVSWIPVARQNLDSLRDSVGLASTIVDGGRRILDASSELEGPDGKLEVPLSSGVIPLDAVKAAQREVSALTAVLPGRAEGESRPSLLLGPVSDLRRRVLDEAYRRRDQLDVLGRGLQVLADMSGGSGPRRYLIAVANTAEMRGSGGMILSYGVMEGTGGDFALTTFGRIDELDLDGPVDPAKLELPADYLARWSGFDVTERWRNATMSPDLTLVGPVLEQMYVKATGLPVDGVIQIDSQGLAAVLEGIGPVQVPELGTVASADVVPLTLNDAYRRFPGIEQRSDVLGDVAEAAFNKLFDGQYESLRPLATALVRATAGRHILLHAEDRDVRTQTRFFKADGSLPAADQSDYALLTVQNVSANKLDYYLDTSLRLTGKRPVGKVGTMRAEITLTNAASPADRDPVYVFGPFNADQQVGLYRGIVSLYLPAGATVIGSSGDAPSSGPAAVAEDGRSVATFSIDVPAGTTRTVVLDLRLAPRAGGPYTLTLVPSPRVRPTKVSAQIDAGAGNLRGEVEMNRQWVLRAGR